MPGMLWRSSRWVSGIGHWQVAHTQFETEEDNTPPLVEGVDRRRFVMHRGHSSPCGLTVAMNARASYCSHGHLRIEPELQKEPGWQGKPLRVRSS